MSTDIIVPAIIAFVSGYCIYKKTDFFGAFLDGAKDGLYSAASVLPALCLLMTAVGMIRASGALDALASAISPLLDKTVFPINVLPLALLRPFPAPALWHITKNFAVSFLRILTLHVLLLF